MASLKSDIDEIINSSINSVKADHLIKRKIALDNDTLIINGDNFNLNNYDGIYIIGAGKASAFMAKEIENILDNRITDGTVSVKYGHVCKCKKTKIIEAGHPIIDNNSILAAEEILNIASSAKANDLVICLLSGGGSALMEKLADNISLKDFQTLNKLLLECGADIDEINTIRKHVSLIKGGQLAKALYPATCITLILSDVIGDPLETIASGPTAPDATTFSDSLKIIYKYGLETKIPNPILKYLENNSGKERNETLKPGDLIFNNVKNVVIGNLLEALSAAKHKAQELGYNTTIVTNEISGEARGAAKIFSALIQDIIKNQSNRGRPACLLMGGETTVTVTGNGKGGRNQEFALSALLEMKNITEDFIIASVGTDGTDGPTDAAGGFINNNSWEIINDKKLEPLKFLENNDAYNLLDEIKGLIKTGPTGTNVMDLIIALIP